MPEDHCFFIHEVGRREEAVAAYDGARALGVHPGMAARSASAGVWIADLLSVARRLGLPAITRIDQALDAVAEPITPREDAEVPLVERRLLEPIGLAEAIEQLTGDLLGDLSGVLQGRGLRAKAMHKKTPPISRSRSKEGLFRPSLTSRCDCTLQSAQKLTYSPWPLLL
ncbi:hypothetical protein [Sphingomonas sp. BK580]|uniref:hypothetical protein n=1 Tax=Sphingomonas sp. BK580 TaxID=2586972 RepID=UPI001613D2CB|nr:hypothetical protein [Sphingomonas sp. BK580]MBB3694914.1 hypothetical protein [Sphingomonas sp. BK580]